jgi:hypothetical protein
VAGLEAQLTFQHRRLAVSWFNSAAACLTLDRIDEAPTFGSKVADDEQLGARAREILERLNGRERRGIERQPLVLSPRRSMMARASSGFGVPAYRFSRGYQCTGCGASGSTGGGGSGMTTVGNSLVVNPSKSRAHSLWLYTHTGRQIEQYECAAK